ncbi:hypothetical protein [Schaalia sp. ZJ1691]|uniref:hypothetical protein n=1 Tax=Schaalia sp. ZJ1691 TaxID=2709404 RepID=UPI0013ED1B98|nr:hypothetical protein [Schaalia sp. ZJ1691]
MQKIIHTTLASVVASSMLFSFVPAASAFTSEYRSLSASSSFVPAVNSQDQILVDEVAEHLLKGFHELDQYIISDAGGMYAIDFELLRMNGVNLRDSNSIQNLVNLLNSQRNVGLNESSSISVRSWSSFGLCVVGGITGMQLKEISSYVAWKEFGTAIKAKDWGTALNFLKSGVARYMAKHGAKAGAKVALKQILNVSGVGFATQAAVAAVGCAALEGWRWWQS